jgi:hypothetical protein
MASIDVRRLRELYTEMHMEQNSPVVGQFRRDRCNRVEPRQVPLVRASKSYTRMLPMHACQARTITCFKRLRSCLPGQEFDAVTRNYLEQVQMWHVLRVQAHASAENLCFSRKPMLQQKTVA